MSNPKSSLVSVCIPSYNHARYLSDTIESVLEQTYPNIEIIIVDDGSTDDSLAIARQYAELHPDKIHVYTHPDQKNHGISATVNYAFSLSQGAFWSGLPSDDMLLPEKIEKQVKYLESNPDIGFVYSYAGGVNDEGIPLGGSYRWLGEDISCEPDPVFTLLGGNRIYGMTVLARRETIAQTGEHKLDLIYSDWEFWIRLLLQTKVGFIREPLVKYRIHDLNASISAPFSLQLKYGFEVLRSLRNEIPVNFKLARLNHERYLTQIDNHIDKLVSYMLADPENGDRMVRELRAQVDELRMALAEQGQFLQSLTQSRGWKLLQTLWLIRRYIPATTGFTREP
jgi:glycosyltransferase involved in cell wall biosynthesis